MKIVINKNLQIEGKTGTKWEISEHILNLKKDLARQIEAEHWLTYVYPKLGHSKNNSDPDKTRVMEGIKWGLFPIYVEQIFDAGNLPLKFSSLISEYLDFGDLIFVLTTEALNDHAKAEQNLPVVVELPSPTSSPVSPLHANYSFDNEMLDAKFYQVLHHELGLKYFNEFCLEGKDSSLGA